MPRQSLDEIFGSSARPSLDDIFGQSTPKPQFSTIQEANAAMQQAQANQKQAEFGVSQLGLLDRQIGTILKPATQTILGAANTITGGLSGAYEKATGLADKSSPYYKGGELAGYIPVGIAASGAAAGMPILAGRPILQGMVAGAMSGGITTPENRALGAAGGALVGGAIPAAGIAIKASIPKTLEEKIINTYSKSINPNISKVKNTAKFNEFKDKSVQAMKSIANNSDNIQFENPNGLIENRLPRTRIETFEALKQTKQNIYDKYNSLQKQATEKGATIDVGNIAKESFKEIENSRQFSLYEPSLQRQAKALTNRIKGTATVEDVQKDLEFLNQKMKGYYQKGDYNAANIYAKYAGNLRSNLDTAIEKSLDKSGYKDLRKEYASLKFVEEDLAKAAARQLKQVDPKFGEAISDPLAMLEMAHGVFTSNPLSFAAGASLKGVTTLRKFLNNPDNQIKTMFELIKKSK